MYTFNPYICIHTYTFNKNMTCKYVYIQYIYVYIQYIHMHTYMKIQYINMTYKYVYIQYIYM